MFISSHHVCKQTSDSLSRFGKITALFSFFLFLAVLPISVQAEESADSSASSFSGSLRLGGEVEHFEKSNSLLNPSNILMRPDTRAEAFLIGNALYKGIGGVFEAELRFSYEYFSGTSKTYFEDQSFDTQVNQLYYQTKSGPVSLLLGRKKVRWGVGYSYSPTDLISQLKNPEDPDDRLNRIKGTDLVQLSYNNENSQLDLVYLPKVNWSFDETFISYNKYAMRWYNFIDPVDLSFVGSVDEEGEWAAGINTSVSIGKALELHAEYLYQSSNNKRYPDLYSNASDLAIPFFFTKNGGVHDVVVGGQYTFENNLNLTLEYLYRSSGYSNNTFNAYVNHLDYLNADYQTSLNPLPALAGLQESAINFDLPLHNHYLFGRLYHPDVIHGVSVEMYSLVSIADGSGLFVFMPKYEKNDAYEVYLRVKKFWGKNDTEFGLVPEDLSGIIGVSLFLGN
ncbi:hypothetical protein Cpha266_1096 [Chlorobium phaeobacteroides DSM 266]|jgi:hypothetical protein|uniref:Uncharacterized protein n=1 Tax=Chlorobium phaeobacteroides (strain DSM 266 / SMG 266 / 2430) TaxID=290317 RepID=A1BFG0_CHLPD|nr:hypothetical protein Cpha266_1096 [Chlorobium phaeobacteroides DSM 266]